MPARRGAERVRVRADLVDDVAVGADPVGAEDHRVDLAAGHQERPGAVDRDPEVDAEPGPAPTRSAGRPAAAAGSRWRSRRRARRAGAARRPRPARCRRRPRPARRCCSGSAAAAAARTARRTGRRRGRPSPPTPRSPRRAPRSASASTASGPSGSRAAARRAPRARFTAVGRAVSTRCTAARARRRRRRARAASATPNAPATPSAGAPRTASRWIAATSSSTVASRSIRDPARQRRLVDDLDGAVHPVDRPHASTLGCGAWQPGIPSPTCAASRSCWNARNEATYRVRAFRSAADALSARCRRTRSPSGRRAGTLTELTGVGDVTARCVGRVAGRRGAGLPAPAGRDRGHRPRRGRGRAAGGAARRLPHPLRLVRRRLADRGDGARRGRARATSTWC